MAGLPLAPPPQPAAVHVAPNIARRIVAANALTIAGRFGRRFESRLAPKTSKRSRITAMARCGAERRFRNRFERGTLENGKFPPVPPLVVTITVNCAGFPLEIYSVAGPWMDAAKGAPLYARETVPV